MSDFASTRWTVVLRARGDSTEARSALSDLCATYYAPVVTFVRTDGRDEDTARELAHEFFARILGGQSLGGADPARGRFRSYLLGAVKHYLRDQRARHHAEKRGSGFAPEPLATEPGVAAPDEAQRDRAFDRQWALTVIARALEIVGDTERAAGREKQFEVLKPWLNGVAPPSQAEAAQQLAMNEGAAKVAIHRLRQRFRDAVKAEIAQTVPAAADVDDELRHLITVLA